MVEEIKGELAFLDTLMKRKIAVASLQWHIESLRILANTYTTALATKQVARIVLFPTCLMEDIPLSAIKMT